MYRLMIGNSMKPLFSFVSLIKIEKQDKYFVGDVVAFKGNNGIRFCHRIINIDDNVFTTKGDNKKISKNYEIDVPVNNIEGKVIGGEK